MGKITDALQKAAKERIERLDKVVKIQEQKQVIVRKMKESKVDARLIPYFDPKSTVSEQYKSLTTNLMSLNKGRHPKTIAITSSIASEGKSVTALNLAITLSQAMHKPRILLIDADMRKGKMVNYLGVGPHKGLSEYLAGQVQLNEIIFNIDIEHLSFISCGAVPSHPAELLASLRMKDLLNQLSPQFEFILIDTPPVIPVTDAVIIGAQVDGVVVVIKAGETQRGMVQRAGELLNQAHAHVLGHILTGIEYFVPEYIYKYL
ncbi:MAG: CpsD/CapB family tyrosine-protein kinase [Candidatus Omnitrophica bacterium]|nr:CpsD/CapB family tyrosine-protein kinase [Candidatus Omnitrophota bacterium]